MIFVNRDPNKWTSLAINLFPYNILDNRIVEMTCRENEYLQVFYIRSIIVK